MTTGTQITEDRSSNDNNNTTIVINVPDLRGVGQGAEEHHLSHLGGLAVPGSAFHVSQAPQGRRGVAVARGLVVTRGQHEARACVGERGSHAEAGSQEPWGGCRAINRRMENCGVVGSFM
ncbi:hypothetical protein E2C01_069596 [Portunus trituberculatus]|uniref:Uncharacterized protein n=1 Tax=Portunus trituberculatus TaxID=210409 RepID=A0A5B7HYZ4_PORTR|nr:hypothetical protein [Portunus trituberculatus]